jgi:predicted AAA+ superfamily ATPase
MKKRLLYNELVRYLDHKNALIITGMRQVGKTTLMRQIYDEIKDAKLWFDFENPLDTMYFEDEDYNDIYRNLIKQANNGKPVIFIDEIQNFPRITSIIKYHIDHYRLKYIITGSSNFYLRNLFPESLSGRKFLFTLRPLDFAEIKYFKDINVDGETIRDLKFEELTGKSLIEYKRLSGLYEEYLEFGGFPEVVVTDNIESKKMVLRNIFASFFEKDLKLLSDIKDIRELRNLILLLVPRTGNMIDVTRIASELGISRIKVYDYLELLQGTFFIKLIPKFSSSIDKSVAGGRKLYFSDTGILNVIGKVNDGQLFENAVANQLLSFGELSFYNKRNSAEIDFILNKKIAFEAKMNATSSDYNKTKRIASSLDIDGCFVISKNHVKYENVIPAHFL